MADDPVRVCPECAGQVHRVIQPVGVIFKGSGFYITDNRQVSSPTLGASKDAEKKTNDSKGETGESKKETPVPASTAQDES
jgi:predicted nucleic acid-binding Zn ribbon protein